MIPRLYLDRPLRTGESVALAREACHYLHAVLRRNRGDSIIVFNGRGGEFHARIEHVDGKRGQLAIEAYDPVSRELTPAVHIVQAACRNEKLEWMLQKCVELGAASVQIARSQRAELRLPAERRDKRLARWRKIVIEASEQCGRTLIPSVRWHERLGDIEARGLCLCLHPAGANSWPELCPCIRASDDITLAIGPEGGWSPSDLQVLREMGFRPMAFGPRILRTETAAAALLAAIQGVCWDVTPKAMQSSGR